jgi:hypothetical protein
MNKWINIYSEIQKLKKYKKIKLRTIFRLISKICKEKKFFKRRQMYLNKV